MRSVVAIVTASVSLSLLAASAGTLRGQETEGTEGAGETEGTRAGDPLRKSDLVRALTSGPSADAAALVRRRCVSFRPTERDVQDLRVLGAEEDVLAAIRTCLARAAPERAERAERTGRSMPMEAPERAARPEEALTLFLAPVDVVAPAGGVVSVTAQVTARSDPVSDLLVTVHEEGVIGWSRMVATGRTDGRGTVAFRLPVEGPPGLVRRFVLRAGTRPLRGRNVVLVQVLGRGASGSGGASGHPPPSSR